MHFILRDWDRIWYLAFLPEANRCPGTAVADLRSARLILSRLILDPKNLSVMRSFLASGYVPGARAIPIRVRPLLSELELKVARRECVLARGARYDLRSGGGRAGGSAASAAEGLEVWDFTAAEGDGEDLAGSLAGARRTGNAESDEGLPLLRFSGGCEAFPSIRFAHGADAVPGLAFAHASGKDPAFRFEDAAEGAQGLAHSAAVGAPP
ncbi:MAG TPA: hypothetical protein VJ385_00335 [Fibrobacteria bacterium]|nr:hypothetical protein [Fibrobacteria bacterium]